MRYGSFCIMACLLAVSVSFGRNAVTLVDERGGEIILNFTLPQYDVSDVVVNGEVCNFIRVPGSIYPAEKGFPNLPRISGSLVIPNNAAMGLEIVDIQYKEVNVKRIMPSRGRIYRHQDPEDIPYSFGKIYTEDKWYPETAAFLGDPFIMRDVRGITVYFHPVSYNPAQGKVKIAESITVKVKNTGPGKVNVLRTTKRLVSPAYEKIYNRHFLNYADNRSRYTPVDDGDKMIVISPSSFLSAMEPFVEWKNKKGIQTEIFEYPDETGGSGSDNIQNFIQQKYDDDNITYILLVGDHDDLPSVIISNSSYISGADPAYTF